MPLAVWDAPPPAFNACLGWCKAANSARSRIRRIRRKCETHSRGQINEPGIGVGFLVGLRGRTVAAVSMHVSVGIFQGR